MFLTSYAKEEESEMKARREENNLRQRKEGEEVGVGPMIRRVCVIVSV